MAEIDYEDYLVCRTLDAPMRVVFWTLDEFAILACTPALALVTKQYLVFCIIGLLMWQGLKKVKRAGYQKRIKSMIYWYTNSMKTVSAPPSAITHYVS